MTLMDGQSYSTKKSPHFRPNKPLSKYLLIQSTTAQSLYGLLCVTLWCVVWNIFVIWRKIFSATNIPWLCLIHATLLPSWQITHYNVFFMTIIFVLKLCMHKVCLRGRMHICSQIYDERYRFHDVDICPCATT